MSMAATIFADETQISTMTVAGRAGPKKMSGLRSRNLVARGPSTVWRRSSRLLLPTRRTLARSWRALPLSVRAVLLMVTGSLLFSVMGALVKLLGQQIDSFQIAFFRCFFGFIAILPFILLKRGRHAFRTTHLYGHFLRGALGVAAIVAGFYATTRLPLTRLDSDQLYRPAVHDPHRHLPARRKGALAAGARHRCRLYRRIGNGPARQRDIGFGRHRWADRRLSGGALDDLDQALVGDRKGADRPRLFRPVRPRC